MFSGCLTTRDLSDNPKIKGVENFHKVSDDLYRGAQPISEGIKELKKLGIKTIVNLRLINSDREEIGYIDIGYEHINMEAWRPEEDEIIRFLEIMQDSEKTPVFVHCHYGSDRTGIMVAIYRMVMQDWTKEQAIAEMTDEKFDFHPVWQNLIEFVEELDVENLKNKIKT